MGHTLPGRAAFERHQASREPHEAQQKQLQVLHSEWDNLVHKHRMGNNPLQSSSAEKALGILVDNKLTMGQQCTLHGKDHQQWVQGGDPFALYATCETTSGAMSVQSWAPQCKKGVDILEEAQHRATEVVRAIAPIAQGEAERAVSVQPGEEKAPCCLQPSGPRIRRSQSQTLFRGAWVTEQEATDASRNMRRSD